MKTIIETKSVGTISINSVFLGNKPAKWDSKSQIKTNHRVTIACRGIRTSFEFWGSIAEPEITKDEQNIFALYCFLSDSCAGKDSFEDFCSEFGYDTDSRSAERIHNECIKSLKKAEKFCDDIYELINEIQETYEC